MFRVVGLIRILSLIVKIWKIEKVLRNKNTFNKREEI